MKTVTLRIPQTSYRRLVELCRVHAITIRGAFEDTTTICMRDMDDPDRRDATLLLWEAAKTLDESPDFPGRHPKRINAKFDDDAVAMKFAAACRHFGVSQNAALGLVVAAPWPVSETELYRQFRHENWQRIVELAREMEFSRRPYAAV